MCSQPAAGKMEAPQQYCLRWKYHHSNLQAMFSQLLERECFCDVTLACEGKTLKAHKVMLSACSTYFDSIFSQYEESNPIVILKDVKFSDIKALVQFMYKGEINVDNSELTSLLKTAEELRIKGLAEVSWRSDREMEATESGDDEADFGPPQKKIKSESYSPKSVQNSINSSIARDDYKDSHDDIDDEGDDGSETEWESERSRNDLSHFDDSDGKNVSALSHSIVNSNRLQQQAPYSSLQQQSSTLVNTPNAGTTPQIVTSTSATALSAAAAAVSNIGCNLGGALSEDDKCSVTSASAVPGNTPYSTESASTASIDLSQYPDIMKMNDYLESGGRRPQFWEEPFTKRLMEAIKNKELEMKVAAELMGVSYGTLYGRYRDAYGCLKHPYRVRDFWSEQGPAEVLAKLQRKELTLFRAAEMLNVTVTTLANYLSTLRQGGGTGSSDNEDVSDSEDMVIDEDKISTHSSSTTHSSIHNNPDITIVKKENLTNLNGN